MYKTTFKEINKIKSESDNDESTDEKNSISDAMSSVFVKSTKIPDNIDVVKGINFDKEINIHEFINHYKYMGFQATNLGIGIDEINKMIHLKYIDNNGKNEINDNNGNKKKCMIWLSFTSNMISSGLREIFVYLAKNRFVDVIVTTAGGIEEDIIKCFSNTYLGDFSLNGKKLRKKGWNRIGNLIVPNENYCKFEDWLQPLLNKMLDEQNEKNEEIFLKKLEKRKKREEKKENEKKSNCDQNESDSDEESDLFYLSPSEFINRLGKEINDESSLIYWCYKNNIPVFCPGLTDGSLGDNLFFHNYGKKIKNNLILDIIKDIKKINSLALNCRKSGIIILGGGLPKHHVCNANLMRNGADYAVYVNTANEYDGSDSGANTTEALSWGKIKSGNKNNHVKVFGDATILFPLMVLNTFYLYSQNKKKRNTEIKE
ncbi:deoxyhypusine synthase, putative [Plasmodium gallinaceum]|uniref:Deoxyhypusine synthase, putative n=1 Tax=Plasmodium gallinaceum TaxID=5849 RepID=A0A1J1GWG3_PLAGA|nr:deoxyhypusine synthase, putative [Plasmodium gallinaceum]CRG95645.1 deoxyhypusine synthase, putative [Plasmodium gallinaceum]